MAGQSHIILRQLLELNLQPEREGDYQHLSEELSNLGQSFLPGMLDQVFSDLIPFCSNAALFGNLRRLL